MRLRREKKLAKRHLREGAMVFYDVSSSSYYGTLCSLAQRGKNRDGVKLPCIVYGLLTDADGRPVAIRVYPGNTGDPATVPEQVNALRKDFAVGRFVIVGDRGMLTEAQIAKLREHDGCGWISCLRSSDIRTLLESQDPSDAPLFTQRNIAEITHPDFPGERLVACYNEFLAADRDRTRKELLACTRKLLEKLSREVRRRTHKLLSAAEIGVKAGRIIGKYKMAKHFALSIGDGRIALAPLLYVDEDLEPTRTTRDPVARAVPSLRSQHKAAAKTSEEGWPLRRWDGLLQTMATITENICRVGEAKLAVRFPRVTEANDYQKRVFALLEELPDWSNHRLCPVNGTENER